MSFAKKVWETLSAIDCSAKIEKKGNLSYLSWAWAWGMLMEKFPESEYVIEAPERLDDGSVMCWVSVSVKEGESTLTRRMWLPVMDHRNNAIQNPDMRKISDTQMRGLVKCLAMFGLGHYIYAGEDVPDPAAAERAAREAEKEAQEHYLDLVADNNESIAAIKSGIESGELSQAAEAWFELDQATMAGLWKAPSRGGCFTTKEREIMKSPEFRKAYYGEG